MGGSLTIDPDSDGDAEGMNRLLPLFMHFFGDARIFNLYPVQALQYKAYILVA